jgi:hypothetical protein
MTAKYDVHIETLNEDQVAGVKFLTFGDYKKSLGVKGFQKMVNRFIKCLMTPLGTDLSDKEYGTILADSLGNNVDPGAAYSLVAQSVVAAENKIQEYDTLYEFPDDERLGSVQVDNVVTDPSSFGVLITLRLRNVAGTVATITISQLFQG